MLIVERQQRLLEMLREAQTATLEAMSDALGVSGSTVRRDLETLEQQGLIERTHGGAIYRGPHHHSLVFAERMHEHPAAKQAIGAYAAELVEPQMTVCLDGGSTVYYAARQIEARPIQVVTNSLSIANLFTDDEKVELLFVGGNLYPRTGVMLGPIATSALATLHADLLLFSLAGIHDDEAFNQNIAMAEVEQTMMRQAARSVLLMDSRKFGRKSLARVCHVSDVDLVVSDAGVSDRWVKAMGDRLVAVDVPENGNGV
ncbi:MAG: DeoR family transcriptional regulator [Planctomycetaceae bacterium]|nr:DeoR family transcriptional regulator [Planctomycetaceae bacterium]